MSDCRCDLCNQSLPSNRRGGVVKKWRLKNTWYGEIIRLIFCSELCLETWIKEEENGNEKSCSVLVERDRTVQNISSSSEAVETRKEKIYPEQLEMFL
tara:strand:- start:299 stop:592 length:294 start_codon:yes stop_codon:yes gene_type:complete